MHRFEPSFKGASTTGALIDQVETYVDSFLEKYKGAATGLNMRVSAIPREAFGNFYGIEDIKAAFDPRYNRLILVTTDVGDTTNIQQILQHDLFVHKDLGLFSTEHEDEIISATEKVRRATLLDLSVTR